MIFDLLILELPQAVYPVQENTWQHEEAEYFATVGWYVFASQSSLLILFWLVVSTGSQDWKQSPPVDRDRAPERRKAKEQC